jgi:hypothetical protein
MPRSGHYDRLVVRRAIFFAEVCGASGWWMRRWAGLRRTTPLCGPLGVRRGLNARDPSMWRGAWWFLARSPLSAPDDHRFLVAELHGLEGGQDRRDPLSGKRGGGGGEERRSPLWVDARWMNAASQAVVARDDPVPLRALARQDKKPVGSRGARGGTAQETTPRRGAPTAHARSSPVAPKAVQAGGLFPKAPPSSAPTTPKHHKPREETTRSAPHRIKRADGPWCLSASSQRRDKTDDPPISP